MVVVANTAVDDAVLFSEKGSVLLVLAVGLVGGCIEVLIYGIDGNRRYSGRRLGLQPSPLVDGIALVHSPVPVPELLHPRPQHRPTPTHPCPIPKRSLRPLPPEQGVQKNVVDVS